MLESIRSLFETDGDDVVLECRNCGTTVDAPADHCPHCGPDGEIVRYEID